MDWRTIAIIFIILFGVLLFFNIWAINYYSAEEKRTDECYYDFCSEYPDADYIDGVCFCYENDIMGGLIVADTKVM